MDSHLNSESYSEKVTMTLAEEVISSTSFPESAEAENKTLLCQDKSREHSLEVDHSASSSEEKQGSCSISGTFCDIIDADVVHSIENSADRGNKNSLMALKSETVRDSENEERPGFDFQSLGNLATQVNDGNRNIKQQLDKGICTVSYPSEESENLGNEDSEIVFIGVSKPMILDVIDLVSESDSEIDETSDNEDVHMIREIRRPDDNTDSRNVKLLTVKEEVYKNFDDGFADHSSDESRDKGRYISPRARMIEKEKRTEYYITKEDGKRVPATEEVYKRYYDGFSSDSSDESTDEENVLPDGCISKTEQIWQTDSRGERRLIAKEKVYKNFADGFTYDSSDESSDEESNVFVDVRMVKNEHKSDENMHRRTEKPLIVKERLYKNFDDGLSDDNSDESSADSPDLPDMRVIKNEQRSEDNTDRRDKRRRIIKEKVYKNFAGGFSDDSSDESSEESYALPDVPEIKSEHRSEDVIDRQHEEPIIVREKVYKNFPSGIIYDSSGESGNESSNGHNSDSEEYLFGGMHDYRGNRPPYGYYNIPGYQGPHTYANVPSCQSLHSSYSMPSFQNPYSYGSVPSYQSPYNYDSVPSYQSPYSYDSVPSYRSPHSRFEAQEAKSSYLINYRVRDTINMSQQRSDGSSYIRSKRKFESEATTSQHNASNTCYRNRSVNAASCNIRRETDNNQRGRTENAHSIPSRSTAANTSNQRSMEEFDDCIQQASKRRRTERRQSPEKPADENE